LNNNHNNYKMKEYELKIWLAIIPLELKTMW
jgi:hypothetical protein